MTSNESRRPASASLQAAVPGGCGPCAMVMRLARERRQARSGAGPRK